jgi:hypothetical protein
MLVACPHGRHAFPPQEHPGALPSLPPFEELRQLSYAELLRMYRERARLDGIPASCCTHCGGRASLPACAKERAVQQAKYERLRKPSYDELVKQYHELLRR